MAETTAEWEKMRESVTARRWLFAAWAMGLVATLGSLFFAEVMKLPPCSLCWYQRIAMYPLVVILTVGILVLWLVAITGLLRFRKLKCAMRLDITGRSVSW